MVDKNSGPQSHSWDSSDYEIVFRDEQGNLLLAEGQETESEPSADTTSDKNPELPRKVFV